MSVRVLHCSVCQQNFDTRRGWLSHLLQPYHQTKARKEICGWNQSERECVLVAFSTSSIASDELLHFFSTGVNNLVTDFVWFESRPKIGFLQFESKHKVEQILSSFPAPEIRIINQIIQIKNAGECLRLEWQEIIPFPTDELLQDPDEEEKTTTSSASEIIASSSKLIFADQKICDRDDDLLKDGQISALAQVVPGDPDRPAPDQSKELLVNHYKRICKAIEISDKHYEKTLKCMKRLRILLNKQFPACQLIWFRNWHLKLKTTFHSVEPLIFFVDQEGMYERLLAGDPSAVINFPAIKKAQYYELLYSSSAKNRLDIHPRLTLVCENMEKWLCYNFCCKKNDLTFKLVLRPEFLLPEIQARRLLSYFCTFDPRVKSLLMVIRYWLKTNGISLGKPDKVHFESAPEPAALDWLVIFFLCYKKKILPTPRHVTKRPHPKLKFNRVDIGFTEDATFAQQYSSRYQETKEEAHAYNLFSLTHEFFNFFSSELNLVQGERLVFNTRDGELIPMKEFNGDIKTIPTRLDLLERKLARQDNKNPLDGSVIVLHPLHVRYGFSFCDKNFVTSVCPAMQMTGRKLRRGLNLYNKNGKKFNIRSTFVVNEKRGLKL